MNDPAMVAAEKIIEAFPALRGQMLHGMPTIIRDAYAETWAAKDAEIAEWKRSHQAREEQAVVDRTNIHCLTTERDRLAETLASKDAEISGLIRDAAGIAEERDRLAAVVKTLRATRREEIERLVCGTQGAKRSSSAVSMLAGMTRDTLDEIEMDRDRLAAEVERLETASVEDDQEWDGTDFAHPAYWRGEEVAVHVLCQQLNEIMDGKSIGSGIAREPWESTRRRVERLTRQVEELLSALRNMLGMFDTPHARLLFRKAWTDMHSEACRGARAAIDAALKEQP